MAGERLIDSCIYCMFVLMYVLLSLWQRTTHASSLSSRSHAEGNADCLYITVSFIDGALKRQCTAHESDRWPGKHHKTVSPPNADRMSVRSTSPTDQTDQCPTTSAHCSSPCQCIVPPPRTLSIGTSRITARRASCSQLIKLRRSVRPSPRSADGLPRDRVRRAARQTSALHEPMDERTD